MLWKRIAVRDEERALVAKNGRFKGIYLPGEYRIFAAPGVSLEIEKHYVRDVAFRSDWSGYLIEERPEIVERYFTRVETNDTQVAMVYVDGKLFSILMPAKRMLFWRGRAEVAAEVIDIIGEPEIPRPMLAALERVVDIELKTLAATKCEASS